MKKAFWLGLAFLMVSAGEGLPGESLEISVPEIRKYYTDYSYVVAHSTVKERRELARQASERPNDRSLPADGRLRALYWLIRGLLAAERDVDPYMVRGNRLAADFLYAKIPLSFTPRTRDHVSIETLRQEIRVLSGSEDRESRRSMAPGLLAGRNEVRSYIEVDYWDLIQGAWRLSSFHVYPLGR